MKDLLTQIICLHQQQISRYNNPFFLNFSAMPLFTFLPISTAQSSKSLSVFNCFNNSSFQTSSSVFCMIDFLINPDQLISKKRSIFVFTSSGIANVTLTI